MFSVESVFTILAHRAINGQDEYESHANGNDITVLHRWYFIVSIYENVSDFQSSHLLTLYLLMNNFMNFWSINKSVA